MQTIQLNPILHRGQECIAMHFEKDTQLNNIVKKLPQARWSITHKYWYVPLNRESFDQLQKALKAKAIIDSQGRRFIFLNQNKQWMHTRQGLHNRYFKTQRKTLAYKNKWAYTA